jgi:hypothetical protein
MAIDHGQTRDMISPFLEFEPGVVFADDHIEIHTSDRALFKRCRRKWNWQSGMRENLIPLGQAVDALWFGSGWHFLMEDYHGYRKFPTMDHAIVAYKEAFRHSELPGNVRDLMDLMAGMADYYVNSWLVYHPDEYETLWVNGVPQVEVDVDIDITVSLFAACLRRFGSSDWLANVLHGRPVIYRLTFDRVVVTPEGFIRGVDYKTARQIDTNKLSNDPQVESYHWGGSLFYGDQFDGVIWQQFFKGFPDEPEWLSASQRFSFNKKQDTTYPIFRRAIKERYNGHIPTMYNGVLSEFAEQQGDWGDRYIRRDILRRNPYSRGTAQDKILDEVLDMLDPGLPLYPNPTRDCSWDCAFKDACIATDDGSDAEFILSSSFVRWQGYKQDWKRRIVFPDGSVYG